jgi:hypothetical protein
MRAAHGEPAKDTLVALLDAVAKAPQSIGSLADELDISPRRVRELVDQGRGNGLRIDVDGELVGYRPSRMMHTSDERPVVMPAGKVQRYAVISDIHFGSKHHLNDRLQDFIEHVYSRGVRTILCPGDILDGVYRFSVWEQSHRGFKEQCQAAIEGLPRRPGLSFHGILGNHDLTFEDKSGIDVGATMVQAFQAAGRDDLRIYGERGAYLRLKAPGQRRGLLCEMWHPLKGPAYALTYKMQKHIEGYAPGAKPDTLHVGHWHQSSYFSQRAVHATSCGTFQGGQSAFGKALGGSPSIGGWMFEYAMTEDGAVRDFCPSWRAYYEREEVRDVELS